MIIPVITELYNKFRPYIFTALITLVSSFILWLPFLLKINGLSFLDVYRHYDGALYIIPAKTLYEVKKIDIPGVGFILPLPLSPIYFAAHLPMYPVLIRVFREIGEIWKLGYLKSMIGVNLLFSIFLGFLFYHVVRKFKITSRPLLLTTIFLLLPRFLITRSVGAPEGIFIFFMLLSLYFFEKERYLYSGIAGALAVMTKIPGILLVIAYSLAILKKYIRTKKINVQWVYVLLIPLGFLGVFTLYLIQYKDFFAFFHSGGTVPMPYPFSAFNWQAKWVGTAWLEEILFYFFLYGFTVITLLKSKYRSFFYFSLVFLIGLIFVQHRDISRYSLPLWPFACIALEKFFTSKKFLIVLILLLPAIYLYAWNFMQYNVMPITLWGPFL
jgi:hypothetical protein